MNIIVLVCNHDRTISLNHVAESLKKTKSIKVYALVYDDVAKNLVDENCFDKTIYLDEINKQDYGYKYLNDCDFDVIIKKDRKLKYASHRKALNYLYNISKNLEMTFENNCSLTFVGEVSWAVEELVYLYAKKRKFNYYSTIPVRFIDRRWAIVNGLSEEHLLSFRITKTENLNSIVNIDSHPDYFYEVLKTLNPIKRIFEFIFIKKLKAVIPNLIFKKFIYIISYGIFEFFKKSEISNSTLNYLYGFQVQPEASVDYLAPEYSNQFASIDELVANLKPNERIILKDHPGETIFWGGIKKVRYLFNPKIIYLKTDIPVFKLIRSLEGAISITGTLAGELAMKGLKTITLKPVFFNKLINCSCKSNISSALDELRKKQIYSNDEINISNDIFLDYLNNHSFNGYSYQTKEFGFSDPLYVDNLKNILLENKLV